MIIFESALIFKVHQNFSAMSMKWNLKSLLSYTDAADMEQTRKCYGFVDLSFLISS